MRLKVFYEGVDVKPGEIVVVRPEREHITASEAKELHEITQRAFPDNRVVIIWADAHIQKYDRESFLAFLDTLKRQMEGEQNE